MDAPPFAGAGFFGKVGSHGDFVKRRLPAPFVAAWDGWLQAALLASRARLGEAWPHRYWHSPIWRFALAPGVCDEHAWAGVMMASADRVGRCFPLTLAAPAPPDSAARTAWLAPPDFLAQAAWYARLEALATTASRPGFSLPQFDRALAALDAPPAPALDSGVSRWWTEPAPMPSGGGDAVPRLLECRGLPEPSRFADLLDGRWPVQWGVEPTCSSGSGK